jgi:hypothetical protein
MPHARHVDRVGNAQKLAQETVRNFMLIGHR